jgi:hypothetical protein
VIRGDIRDVRPSAVNVGLYAGTAALDLALLTLGYGRLEWHVDEVFQRS